ncbi:hypothetical protein [Burkholderia pseudomallei]|uniref:hypothetical protein n=2 Tax=Burkholderia pseudomallei TaxID=28450 RepID=UPI0011B0CD25|nr:hypothetical protein [Burkholderia pseudomallei]
MTTTDKSHADALTDLSDDELALIREEAARITDDWCERQFMEPSQKESDAKFVREVLRLAASPSSQPAAAPIDDARKCLMDVVSHHDSIVAGFAAQRLAAEEAQDSDAAAYWKHESDVAHRMKAQAERALAAMAQPAPAPADERAALPEDRIDWIANTHCPGGTAYPVNVKNAIREALREARISANETGAEGTKTEAEIRKTMMPEQIRLGRKLMCEAIDGAMAFGYQNTNPPPSADHWLAPYWKIGRKQYAAEFALRYLDDQLTEYLEGMPADETSRNLRDIARNALVDIEAATRSPAMEAAALAEEHSTIECQAHSGPDCTECGGTGVWSGKADERAASWHCEDPVQKCRAQCDSCAKQARAATEIADERAVSFEAWCDRFPEISAVERLRDAWQEARAAASPAMAAEAVAFEITEQAAAEWASRHDVDHVLKHFSTQRNAIEDARTLHLLAAAPQPAQAGARIGLTAEARATIMDACQSISRSADSLKAGCVIGDEWPDAEDKAFYDAELRLLARLVALLNDSGQSEPETATVARIEQLRKALFESRDAMRVMSNWVKKSDPAGHSWAVRMVDRANAALNGEPEPRAEVMLFADNDERDEFIRVCQDFDDDGETCVDYELLMKWASNGLLDCDHFTITKKGRAAIDAARTGASS